MHFLTSLIGRDNWHIVTLILRSLEAHLCTRKKYGTTKVLLKSHGFKLQRSKSQGLPFGKGMILFLFRWLMTICLSCPYGWFCSQLSEIHSWGLIYFCASRQRKTNCKDFRKWGNKMLQHKRNTNISQVHCRKNPHMPTQSHLHSKHFHKLYLHLSNSFPL